MKKIIAMMFAAAVSVGFLAAQNPLSFLPAKGGKIIYKTYDGKNNPIATTTYTVDSDYNYSRETLHPNGVINMSYAVTNPNGDVVDSGSTSARYQDGYFYMNMTNHSYLPQMASYMSAETQMMGTFLDYPTQNDPDPGVPQFSIQGLNYTVYSKEDKKDFLSMVVRNRQYVKFEQVTLPIGKFDAFKITYDANIYTSKDGKTVVYKNVEWYAPDKGIIKTQVFDTAGNLVSYTILTEMK